LAVLDVVGVARAVKMDDFFNKINRIMEFITSRYLSLFYSLVTLALKWTIVSLLIFGIYLLEAEFNMQVIANLGNEMFGE
jgi:hypothetical protein